MQLDWSLHSFIKTRVASENMTDIILYPVAVKSVYCRFQVTFQRAVPKFVANLPITFPSSEIGRELRNKVRKFISMFELRL